MIELERVADWQTALSEYLINVRAANDPFAYGSHDCCTFISGAVEAITGVDPMAEFRGQYDTELGSLRALKRIGKGDLPSTLSDKFPAKGRAALTRGDLVFFDGSAGVCFGSISWVVTQKGIGRIMTRDVDAQGWAVG